MEELNDYELMALNKALFYIRFQCTDGETANIKSSQFLIEAHLKILDRLDVFYKKENITVTYDTFIEDENDYLNTIIATIRHIDGWHKLSEDVKKEIIYDFVKPFKIKENTINFLINYNK